MIPGEKQLSNSQPEYATHDYALVDTCDMFGLLHDGKSMKSLAHKKGSPINL